MKKCMTVGELIEKLDKIEDKEKLVRILTNGEIANSEQLFAGETEVVISISSHK
jgi:hemin uptake protein HemP